MIRKILTFRNYFDEFMQELDEKTRRKINQGLLLLATQQRLSEKYVKHLRDGLYELRSEWEGKIYRVFFIFDRGNIVVLFNGFQKKSQKTPDSEIKKALRIKAEYYDTRK